MSLVHIQTQSLHQGRVSQAGSGIAQGITNTRFIPRASARLVCDSDELKPMSSARVHEVRAFDNNRWYSKGGCAKRQERDLVNTLARPAMKQLRNETEILCFQRVGA